MTISEISPKQSREYSGWYVVNWGNHLSFLDLPFLWMFGFIHLVLSLVLGTLGAKFNSCWPWSAHSLLGEVENHICYGRLCQLLGLPQRNYHRLDGLNNGNLFFSQFWRLDIQDQGVSRVRIFGCLPPWLADGHPRLLWPHSLSPGHAHICVLISSSYKDISYSGLGPSMTSFYFNYFFKDSSSKHKYWKLGIHRMTLWEWTKFNL